MNSPFWTVHPVYSSNIIVSGVTILAPVNSANTDGINPDSSSNVLIEDCYIISGDDCIAIKSGWDEYGIAFHTPSRHILIRRLTCISPTSAAIALGSEMSGGIQDVHAEDILAIDTESAIRIKTSVGRGGYVRDVYVRRMKLKTMKYVFWMTGDYGNHPDNHYDPGAVPVIEGISYSDVTAENVTLAGQMQGTRKVVFKGLCLSNVKIGMAKGVKRRTAWNCTGIEGTVSSVSPSPCSMLRDVGCGRACPFPKERFPIERVRCCEE
ncbi:putative polygalacturonase [Acorus gramineus]|uniref:Polygalacturonase n=1 Tax=Acorus gramineus TaxID=55184 RepID=A0AAV9A4Z8_ACOGR|nr:putative polygalacturonase [Acorus gramineus]